MTIYSLADRRPHIAIGECWVADSADVIGDVRIARDVGVWFGAVLRGDNDPIEIGQASNIQDGAMIHTEIGRATKVGARCTVGHHAILHGCSIGDDCLIGMGATILNGATIGAKCLVAARALVTEGQSFAEGSLILGVPARAVRPLSEEEIEAIRISAEHYVAKWRLYAQHLQKI
jgi:carbonic anhydrase/acetyltransferase-like protein (isoleucine patch superfamily)